MPGSDYYCALPNSAVSCSTESRIVVPGWGDNHFSYSARIGKFGGIAQGRRPPQSSCQGFSGERQYGNYSVTSAQIQYSAVPCEDSSVRTRKREPARARRRWPGKEFSFLFKAPLPWKPSVERKGVGKTVCRRAPRFLRRPECYCRSVKMRVR